MDIAPGARTTVISKALAIFRVVKNGQIAKLVRPLQTAAPVVTQDTGIRHAIITVRQVVMNVIKRTGHV